MNDKDKILLQKLKDAEKILSENPHFIFADIIRDAIEYINDIRLRSMLTVEPLADRNLGEMVTVHEHFFDCSKKEQLDVLQRFEDWANGFKSRVNAKG